MSDWGMDWNLPEYPQLPKLFTSAKTAKKRKHKEFIVTDELLSHTVKLPKLSGQGSKSQHVVAQQDAGIASSADQQPLKTGSKQASIRVQPQEQDKLQDAKSKRKSKAQDKQQHQHEQTNLEPQVELPDVQIQTVEVQQTDDPSQAKKKKKQKHKANQQDYSSDTKQGDAGVAEADTKGDALPATDVTAAPKQKKSKNKFKQPDFLAQQAQQQHLMEQQQQRPKKKNKQQPAALLSPAAPADIPDGVQLTDCTPKPYKQQQHQIEPPSKDQPAISLTVAKESKSARKKQQHKQQQEQQQQTVPTTELQLASTAASTPAKTKTPRKKQKPQEQKDQQQEIENPVAQQQHHPQQTSPVVKAVATVATPKPSNGATSSSSGSKLLQQFKDRLAGSRFRQLNEALYTQPGEDSFTQMQEQPELFTQYHEGFQQQVKSWPTQPLDVAIKWLQDKPQEFVVADYGCGEARLAAMVKQEVHSLDLVAAAPGVIACNMAHTPLDDSSCDAAVFSLALMGTDYGEFLLDAARVLKKGGWLWIAEVRSRFAAGNGSEDFRPFLSCLRQLGFQLVKQDAKNKMFVVFVLKKHLKVDAATAQGINWPLLKACVYKKR